MIEFFVPGTAKSTQTGEVVTAGKKRVPTRKNAGWSAFCKMIAHKAMVDHGWKKLEGPLSMGIVIWVKAPKKLKLSERPFPTSGADILNALKGPMDAWQETLYENDSQVIQFHRLEKRWALDHFVPGISVWLRPAVT